MMEKYSKEKLDPDADLTKDLRVQQDTESWQQGQERVLRYLKAIGVPPVQSLELALETMKRTSEQMAKGNDKRSHPAGIAMRLIGRVLAENGLSVIPAHPTDIVWYMESAQRSCYTSPYGLPPHLSDVLPAMPDVRRSRMLPEMQPPRLLRSLLVARFSRKYAPSRSQL